MIDTQIVAAVVLLASAGVPGQSKPCRWGAVTTCDVCNRRYWKCFVARQGSAAVPITRHAICQHAFLATSQCPNLKPMIHWVFQRDCELSFPCWPPIYQHLPTVLWPCVDRAVPFGDRVLRWSRGEVRAPHPLALTFSLWSAARMSEEHQSKMLRGSAF